MFSPDRTLAPHRPWRRTAWRAAALVLLCALNLPLGAAAPAADAAPWEAWRALLFSQPAQVLHQLDAVRADGWPEADRLRLALLRLRATAELGRSDELDKPLAELRGAVEQSGRADLQATWHVLQGDMLRAQGRPQDAAPHWELALKHAERANDAELRSLVHQMRAQVALDDRDMGVAAAALEADRAVSEASGDAQLIARHLYWAGNLSQELEDVPRAVAQFRDAAARFEQLGNPTWQSDSLRLWAEVLIGAERPADALQPAQAAVRLLEKLDDAIYLALARSSLADAVMAHGRPAEALALSQQARAAVAEAGSPATRAGVQFTHARLLVRAGRAAEAERVLAAALPPPGAAPLRATTQRGYLKARAELLTAQGRAREAAEVWRQLIRDERESAGRRLAEQLQAQGAVLRVQTLQRENDLLQERSRVAERALAAETRLRWAASGLVAMLVAGAAGALLWMTRVNRRIADAAARDALTGLLNRRSVLALGEARRQRDRPAAVVLIDVDHFKSVNDTHGHAAGDEVLRQVAARLRHGLRGDDLIARWGGEEFLLVLPGTTLEAAVALAERQRRLVAELPTALPVTAAPLAVTVSAGVSVVLEGERGFEAALERADQALYRAKRAGRNAVVAVDATNGGATPSSEGTSATTPGSAAPPV